MDLKDLLSTALDGNMNEFEAAFAANLDDRIQDALAEKYDDMFELDEDRIIAEEMQMIAEKLVVFNGGAKYGQVVFMSGGAGSGKGFASSKFMEGEKFKIRDVDEWKKAFLKLSELKNKYPEIRGLDLKKGKDVYDLHMFVKKLKIKDKTLDNLLKDVRADRQPNIIFDITGKELSDFGDVLPHLEEAGYSTNNLHLAWVLTDYKVSYAANLTRERVVPADVFLDTHKGASKTMQGIIDRGRLPLGMNGKFVVIMNNRNNTIFFEPGTIDKKSGKIIPPAGTQKWGKEKGESVKNVADFYYITVKEAGKPFKPESAWKEELHKQIVSNVPGGQATVDELRADAIERLSQKDSKKNREGIALVKRDIENEKKEKEKRA